MIKRLLILQVFFTFSALAVCAQLSLPQLVSDGMVLQRDADVTIWGWASADEEVAVHFLGETYHTNANDKGDWEIMLKNLEAGGPYEMRIEASNTIRITDILIGDVWVASGQSNMELPMRRVRPFYEDEIKTADYPNIRYFDVPKRYNFKYAETDLPTGYWQESTSENVSEFSAVAYFFAKNLHERYEVPVGIIHTALGGSPAEAWMSEEALKNFPDHYEEAQRFKDDSLIEQIERGDQERIGEWYRRSWENDAGYQNTDLPWTDPELDISNWDTMGIPGYWADTELGDVNGVVWFRKRIEIPSDWAGKPAELELGRIVDADSVFVNGEFIGRTTYQYPPRWYDIPEGLLQEGENILVVRVVNESGRGGFIPDKPYELIVDSDTLKLEGDWLYRLGTEMERLEGQTFIRWKPLGLFNAMILPLLNYSMKGVIWYQGESNTGRPDEYQELFPAMINDWRNHWGQGDFPFLFVQLANYMKPQEQPSESNWAELREAQMQALSVPNTGMAVTIDIGEWNDIHPLNKKDVGERLALSARKVAYGEDVVHSGPLYESMEIENDSVILSFRHTGSGLTSKGERLSEFAIAGENGNFVWADARIEGERVVVWSDEVSNPVAVRYAWSDNPENANLYNKEGLPATPFRTDDW